MKLVRKRICWRVLLWLEQDCKEGIGTEELTDVLRRFRAWLLFWLERKLAQAIYGIGGYREYPEMLPYWSGLWWDSRKKQPCALPKWIQILFKDL